MKKMIIAAGMLLMCAGAQGSMRLPLPSISKEEYNAYLNKQGPLSSGGYIDSALSSQANTMTGFRAGDNRNIAVLPSSSVNVQSSGGRVTFQDPNFVSSK